MTQDHGHIIKRASDGGIIRVACSCGHAFQTDNKLWADLWQQAHLLGITKRRKLPSKRKHEAKAP